jgi:hypothetical protein
MLTRKTSLRDEVYSNIGRMEKAKELLLQDFVLFHIEELTFEEDNPRKEALENVISALRVDGINFVYILMGDRKGVSFYFGIVKDQNKTVDLQLDVDDIGRYILKSNMEGNFRGSKITEQSSKKETILANIKAMKRVARIDGVPSVNTDNEDFQGVDRLVDVMMGDDFAVIVLASPLSNIEMNTIEDTLCDFYNKLSPLAKVSVQESKGSSDTTGSSVSRNDSKTEGTNSGDSTADAKGQSKGASKTNNESSGNSIKTSTSTAATQGASDTRTETFTNGKSVSKTDGTSESSNKLRTHSAGTNKSREFANKVVSEWMEYIDEVLLKRMEYGRNKGLFSTSIYLLAHEKGTLLKMGNTISALFSGVETNKAPLKLSYLSNEQEITAIKNLQQPKYQQQSTPNMEQMQILFSKSPGKLSSWLSTNELCVIAGLPQKEVVGLPLKEEVEFGLNIKKQEIESANLLLLGNLVRSGSVLDIDVSIDRQVLNKHIFITGVTGSGKTTTCQRILESANMPFLVIEPAKTEYRILTKRHKDILIFTLGDDSVAPFRLNPFEFLEGENITARVDMIKANIEAAFDMEAAIPQIIEAALYKCYEDYGWDIATSQNSVYETPFADGVYAFPTLDDLIKQTQNVVEQQGFDDRLKNDYIGSIKARLQGLLVGSKGFMLNTPRSIDFKKLVERNVILELDEIKSGAEKSLIMGFVLINLNEAIKAKYKEYKNQEDRQSFKHITLIEEAHRLLAKHIPGDSPSKKLGVETFADMLAEVRKYGESLIIVDQIPDKLTPEVLKNTNTKIVHKLFASDDKNAIGNTMSLSDEQKAFLSNLEVGRAIVSNQDFAKPIQVQIKQLNNVSTTESALIEDSKIRELALTYYQKNYKSGIIQGLEVYNTEPTLEQVEELLSMNVKGLLQCWRKLCEADKEQPFGSFRVDVKSYIEENRLTMNLDFLAGYLHKKFYRKRKCTVDDLRFFLSDIMSGLDRFDRKNRARFKL